MDAESYKYALRDQRTTAKSPGSSPLAENLSEDIVREALCLLPLKARAMGPHLKRWNHTEREYAYAAVLEKTLWYCDSEELL